MPNTGGELNRIMKDDNSGYEETAWSVNAGMLPGGIPLVHLWQSRKPKQGDKQVFGLLYTLEQAEEIAYTILYEVEKVRSGGTGIR